MNFKANNVNSEILVEDGGRIQAFMPSAILGDDGSAEDITSHDESQPGNASAGG